MGMTKTTTTTTEMETLAIRLVYQALRSQGRTEMDAKGIMICAGIDRKTALECADLEGGK